MSKSPSLSTDKHPKTPHLPQRIPITYLWFGKEVPEDYLISLAELNYPVQFLKNPPIQRKFSREILDIEKSDYYRLQYLYDHGGIYSDFDNIINYDCLMKLLQPYRNQDKLVFMSIGKHTRAKLKEMTNNLIFAPYPGMPVLKKMLDGINEKKGKIWDFAGMRYVAKFKEPIEMDMSRCVQHTGDWSWFSASNQILKKNTPPHNRYAVKFNKKRDIIAQNDYLERQITKVKFQKNQLSKVLTKVKKQNSKLKQQVNTTKTQAQKNLIEKLKAQDQHKSLEVNKQSEMAWNSDKLLMQGQIKYLAQQNNNLELEKDTLLLVIGGSVILLLVLVIIGILLFRNKKGKQFKYVAGESRTLAEEQ